LGSNVSVKSAIAPQKPNIPAATHNKYKAVAKAPEKRPTSITGLKITPMAKTKTHGAKPIMNSNIYKVRRKVPLYS